MGYLIVVRSTKERPVHDASCAIYVSIFCGIGANVNSRLNSMDGLSVIVFV